MGISIAAQQEKARAGGQPALWAERVLWMVWVPLVVYAVFMAPVPDLHDGMHPVRHSTTIVHCH